MAGSIPLSRRLSAVGTAIGMVAGLVFWCVAANYIAGLTAGAQLNCLVHNQWAPFNLGLRLWEFGSLRAFLLIGGGLTMLLEFGTRRGGRLLSTTICVLLVVLSTWGYVAATHGVMRSAVAQGVQNVSVGAGGVPQHPCQGC